MEKKKQGDGKKKRVKKTQGVGAGNGSAESHLCKKKEKCEKDRGCGGGTPWFDALGTRPDAQGEWTGEGTDRRHPKKTSSAPQRENAQEKTKWWRPKSGVERKEGGGCTAA